jgi:4-amino-4-deoxy-L-arabinose transferase-like glycosyltransferase
LALAFSAPLWSLSHSAWEVDDARYAEVPREMAESRNWTTPSLDYFEYLEKPPLIYWLGAASYRIFGVNEAAARVPLVLLALLSLAGTVWLGAWLFSPQAGALGALALGSCIQFLALSHLITPDMAVSALLLWATAFILRALHRPADARWAGTCAWLAMALAILAKGLIGAVLPLAWLAGLALLFPELRRGAARLFAGPGPWLFAVLIGGWFLAMERLHPGFFRLFVIEQHFARFLTQRYNRAGPWYYFAPVVLVGLLPWTFPAFAAARDSLTLGAPEDRRLRQLLLWPLLVVGFFSVSHSKLVTYILPAFPHLALAAARVRRAPGKLYRRAALGTAAVLALGAILAPLAPVVVPKETLPLSPAAALAAAVALALLAGACAALTRLGRGLEKPYIRAGTLSLAAGALLLVGAGRLQDVLSAKTISLTAGEWAREARAQGLSVRLVAYQAYPQALPYYARLPVDLANWMGEFRHLEKDQRYAGRFLDDNGMKALPGADRRAIVAAPTKELGNLEALYPPGTIKRRARVGPWALAEL